MKLIRGLHNLPAFPNGAVVTIGNFDGVHQGHQHLLKILHQEGQRRNLPTVLITFEPYPQEYFAPETAPARLTRLREKWNRLAALNLVDFIVCVRFNATFANISAGDFLQNILIKRLNTRCMVIGEDFCFGRGREGNFQFLKEYAPNIDVMSCPAYTDQKDRISSTGVRHALATGDLQHAKRLLGVGYALAGRVAQGAKRGRTIGFPTANINLARHKCPVHGVYAVCVHGVGEKVLKGVANVGERPTVDGKKTVLEVHLFNFNDDIYGRVLCVELIEKIREEKKFESFEALKQQIMKDAQYARERLGETNDC